MVGRMPAHDQGEHHGKEYCVVVRVHQKVKGTNNSYR